MTIGNNIKKYRKEKGLTQLELAEKVGLSRNALSNYEINKREPKLIQLKKIALILNIQLSDLIGDNTLDSCSSKKILKETTNISTFSQGIFLVSDFFNLISDKSKFIDLNFEYTQNEPLSVDFFEKLSNSIHLSDEETSFLIVLFLKKTNDPIYKIIEFYKYLKKNYGLELYRPTEIFLDTYENLSTWLNLNLNLNFAIHSQREVSEILINIDNYQKALMLIMNTSKEFTKNEIAKLKNLSIEESTMCFNSLVDSLKFNLFKINTNKDSE